MSKRFIYYGSFASATWFSDDFGMPWCAYSLRKLTPSATNCIRVRRSSDNTEQDIGFAANVPNSPIDTTSLLAFVGAGNGFVTTWYDQTTNARHVSQSSASNQPRIINAGVLEVKNSNPAIRFISANITRLRRLSETSLNIQSAYTSTVLSDLQNGVTTNIFSLNTNPRWYVPVTNNTQTFFGYGSNAFGILSENSDNNQRLYTMHANSTTVEGFTNGVSKGTLSSVSGNSLNIEIGAALNTVNPFNGFFQETITFDSTKSTDRTAIETNITTFYGI
jgi:hypothetical protein